MPGTRIRRSRGVRSPAVIGVTSAAFQDNGDVPLRYTRAGGNVSPALSWSALPKKTASIALICEDPDAPGHDPFTHWVLYNVSPTLRGLPKASRRDRSPASCQEPSRDGTISATSATTGLRRLAATASIATSSRSMLWMKRSPYRRE